MSILSTKRWGSQSQVKLRRSCLWALMLIGLVYQLEAQTSDHVVIITVDGFRPEFYLDPSWGMVNLQQQKEKGIYAKSVKSQFPTVTFVNHTTILTGESSVNHGILYNAPFKPKGQSSEWYWYASDIKSPTLWGSAKEKGLITAAVNWPVSVGGPLDYNIPIIKEKGKPQLQVISENSVPVGFFSEIQKRATGKLHPEDFIVQQNFLAMDMNVSRIAAYIIRNYKPAVLTLRLSAVDHFQHRDGKDSKMVRASVAGVDRAIRNIIEALERTGITDRSTVFVTGDHGFVNSHTSVSPNIWLKDAGIFRTNNDWDAQFHTLGGSAFLMLKEASDNETVQRVKNVLNELPKRVRKFFEIIDRRELDELGVDDEPAFGLRASPGIVFNKTTIGEVVANHRKGTHGYHPDVPGMKTGFIGWGAGLKPDQEIPIMELHDIAPLAAYLLDLDWNTEDMFFLKGVLKE